MNNPNAGVDLDKLEALARAATPGPWDIETVRSEGEYGTDEDGGHGYDAYAVVDSEGRPMLDSLNRDDSSIHTETDGDTFYAWDELAKRDAKFIAAANPATVLELIALARRAEPSVAAGDERALLKRAAEFISNTMYQSLGQEGRGQRLVEEIRAVLASPATCQPIALTDQPSGAICQPATVASPAVRQKAAPEALCDPTKKHCTLEAGHDGKCLVAPAVPAPATQQAVSQMDGAAVAWLATDLDGHGDVAFTKDEARRRAGENCTQFVALVPAATTASASSEPCNPIWYSDMDNQGHAVTRCRNCGTYKGNPCRRAQAPSREVCTECNSARPLHDLDCSVAQQGASHAPLDDNEVARLRRVVRELGMEKEVPQDDETLRGCLFSVLGQIAYKLESRASHAANAGEDTERIAAYLPGQWFDARTLDEMQAFYLSRLPAIREAAKEHGYAIGLHGSTRRDFDLMAMQWREDASPKDALAHAIAIAACGITRDGTYAWEIKPNGRFAVSLPICWTGHSNPEFGDKPSLGHIDLSVIDPTWMITFIEKRADEYLQDHADTEPDTGAIVWHYGDAGRDYHSTLIELAEDLRAALASSAAQEAK